MIHYHGTPITPEADCGHIIAGRHAMVSFAAPGQLDLIADACQSFALDNGAFSKWRAGEPVAEWDRYYDWVSERLYHPGLDFALIPDVIDGDEEGNDELIHEWPDHLDPIGVPVWHLHESLDRLIRLTCRWSRVAIGSSGSYSQIGTDHWWYRMADAMDAICDDEGRPPVKLHGLRMLDPRVFTKFPFASADSTNIARNINLDSKWRGSYQPANGAGRGVVMADRIEAFQSASRWMGLETQNELLFEVIA